MTTTETRHYLDCPTAGPQDVTDEWYHPSKAAGSFVRNKAAAEAMGLDWQSYTRRAGFPGYESDFQPTILIRSLTCPGCHTLARVWLRGRPVDITSGSHKRRAIDVATGSTAKRGKCGGQCLNGKRSCDCRCNARCHGAGECYCKS